MSSSTVAAAQKNIAQAYTSGKFSTLIVIPIEVSRKLRIDKPSNLTVEETKDGVLIKKLNI
jgi:hypothetical protein